jgi:hypothetical protein
MHIEKSLNLRVYIRYVFTLLTKIGMYGLILIRFPSTGSKEIPSAITRRGRQA